MPKFYLEHVNINVLHLEKSLDFYKQALGLVEVRRMDMGENKLVYLSDGAEGATLLELTWLHDRTQPYDLSDNEIHIAFGTKDGNAAYALHQQMGIVCQQPKREGGFYFIEDPDGYWVEICPR